jgi:uncharacterized protein involved in exopolysaccharide biosynthesis
VHEVPELDVPVAPGPKETPQGAGNSLVRLQLIWQRRRMLARAVFYGFLASTLVAFIITARYESTARLMPPDSGQSGGLAMAAAAMSGAAGGLGGVASDFLGLKSTSDIFVGILGSRTVRDKLIQQFDLKKLYGDRRMEDARKDLANHTGISVDRKSQIITITVTDKSPQRAAAMAQAYVEELNQLVAELSTSSARRERIFLEGRLQAVSQDLKARIDELKHQLEKLGGKGESATSISDQPGDSLYPSIRKLPLLGVMYADLYRRTKIQEAVLETLTKEYELAKVQEVKEIPVVKVLDSPNVPDKKSFPPRLLIMLLGTAFAFALATTWVFGRTAWDQTDSNDHGKAFAQEVFSAVKASIPQFAKNGSGDHSGIGKSWNWIRLGRKDKDNEASK